LAEFTRSPEYGAYLVAKIKEAMVSKKHPIAQAFLRPQDMHLADSILKETGIPITEANSDFIGGVLLKLEGKNAVFDLTFQTKLDEAKKSYVTFSLVNTSRSPKK
jgi:vacuolar-type H+-ATPase subunit E/Vma4